jgi:hypothetical protein
MRYAKAVRSGSLAAQSATGLLSGLDGNEHQSSAIERSVVWRGRQRPRGLGLSMEFTHFFPPTEGTRLHH